ncbi:MAG: ferritin-like domain-containing protein [Chitinispirillaceae bacterium]
MSQVFNAEEIFSIGIQIEKNGRLYYQTVADNSSDQELKTLFSSLARWEENHIEIFEKLSSEMPENQKYQNLFDPDDSVHLYLKAVADSHIFVKNSDIEKLALSCNSPGDALELALQFEKDSVVFYSSMKEFVREDLGRNQLDKLIHEELTHVGQITKELNRLNQ